MTHLFIGDLDPAGPEPPPYSVGPQPEGGGSPPAPTSEPAPPAGAGHGGDEGGDLLVPFAPAVLTVRWVTTAVSLALASPALLVRRTHLLAWMAVLLVNTVFRSFRPLGYNGSNRSTAKLVAEVGLHVLAVVATGYWTSPAVLMLINAVIIAGFARGFRFALRIGVASALAVTLPGFGDPAVPLGQSLAQAAQWTTLITLSGVVAGYSRRISGEASRRHRVALDRVARLADANALLANLHRVAQTLPASLDLGDVLDTTVSRLRGLLAHDALVILTCDEPTGGWHVARQAGAGLRSESLTLDRLPTAARRAATGSAPVRAALTSTEPGFSPRSAAGIYLPLLARDRRIGLLAVEAHSADTFTERDQRLLEGFVEPVALAIDNARWFGRIRTVGADEERNRIARDLHDRVGQSLAYLGFEVDRLIRRHDAGDDLGPSLRELRNDLRELVGEVRDTLSDLRTDVTDNRDFAQTAQEFIDRLTRRGGLVIELDCMPGPRLPILQEREMWRIAQEALTNVQRHAGATRARLHWRCDSRGALLEVTDDGRGLPPASETGRIGRPDSYGIVGMRERADSVGATFELTSTPGEGTKLRCFLAQR